MAVRAVMIVRRRLTMTTTIMMMIIADLTADLDLVGSLSE